MSRKLKSHRGAKKRFKVTASGKVRSKKAGARHLLTKKNTSNKRKKKALTTLTPKDAQLVKKLVPNL